MAPPDRPSPPPWVRTRPGGFDAWTLPFGVFSPAGGGSQEPRVGVAVGEHVLDVSRLDRRLLDAPGGDDLGAPVLNPFLARGRTVWDAVRLRLHALLGDAAHRADLEAHLHPLPDVELHLPFAVADYVDFYSSRHHAENLGRLFRPDDPPLTPNWLHLPIGYHGRAGTVRASGTAVVRPHGQHRPAPGGTPRFGPSRALDFEAEVGFVVGASSPLGRSVPSADLAEHVFGVCLVNDWSARDLQAWEYVPLGPFLGKSFLTSVSPWVVPLAALAAARVPPPPRDLPVLPYLHDDEPWGLDLTLEVRLNGSVVSRPAFRDMYWTPAQQLAHLTVNGAALRTGDLFASGTVSGPVADQWGSLIELTRNGADPLVLPTGGTRTFLEDEDTVTISATAPGPYGPIHLGEVSGTVVGS